MFWAEIWKISEFFIWKIAIFLVVIFSVYLNRRVFVMNSSPTNQPNVGEYSQKLNHIAGMQILFCWSDLPFEKEGKRFLFRGLSFWYVSIHLNNHSVIELEQNYSKCTKISYNKISDKMAYANSADPDQTAPEKYFWTQLHKRARTCGMKCLRSFRTFTVHSFIVFELTLVLLNPDMSCLCNSVDPDQLASEEANWSRSALFAIKYVNLYQQFGSSNLIG